MSSTAADRYTFSQSSAFTNTVQILGEAQAKTIIDQITGGNGAGQLISGVTFADAEGIAERFLADQGHYAGKMAEDIVNDPAIEAFWDGAAFTGVTDAAIAGVMPYVFALYRNVP